MPLLDHFRRPIRLRHPGISTYDAWANAIVRQLNHGLLPQRFYALPRVRIGRVAEIDVAALSRCSLWLADDPAVPLELERSYVETCGALRIPACKTG